MNKVIDYFKHDGICYYAGTIVEFYDGQYGRYSGNGETFNIVVLENGNFIENNWIVFKSNYPIKRIIEPVTCFERKFVKVQKDTQSDDMFYAWFFYIIWMLFISITTFRVFGWIVGTLYFLIYRHGKLYKEANRR